MDSAATTAAVPIKKVQKKRLNLDDLVKGHPDVNEGDKLHFKYLSKIHEGTIVEDSMIAFEHGGETKLYKTVNLFSNQVVLLMNLDREDNDDVTKTQIAGTQRVTHVKTGKKICKLVDELRGKVISSPPQTPEPMAPANRDTTPPLAPVKPAKPVKPLKPASMKRAHSSPPAMTMDVDDPPALNRVSEEEKPEPPPKKRRGGVRGPYKKKKKQGDVATADPSLATTKRSRTPDPESSAEQQGEDGAPMKKKRKKRVPKKKVTTLSEDEDDETPKNSEGTAERVTLSIPAQVETISISKAMTTSELLARARVDAHAEKAEKKE